MTNTPKLIIKSGYVKSVTHIISILEYGGDKLDRQELHLKNGDILHFDDKKIDVSKYNVKYVKTFTKDNRIFTFDKDTYETLECKKTYLPVNEIISNSKELKEEMKDKDIFRYLEYIENREGAVKENDTGLFDLRGNISIDDAKELAQKYRDSIAWSHIISLPEDDTRGLNNRTSFANLVRTMAPDIAKIYNISLTNLVINGAYHANTDNPHVHLVVYSKDKTEGYLRNTDKKIAFTNASEKLKSTILNTVFKTDADTIKELLNENRQNLKNNISLNPADFKTATKEKFISLSDKLYSYTGRPYYGYLSPELKNEVSELLKMLVEENAELSHDFRELCLAQKEYILLYNSDDGKVLKRLNDFKHGFFYPDKGQTTTLHNLIIKACKDYDPLKPQKRQATKEKFEIKPYRNPYSFYDASSTYDLPFDDFEEYSFIAEDIIFDQPDSSQEYLDNVYRKRSSFSYQNDFSFLFANKLFIPTVSALKGLTTSNDNMTKLQKELLSNFLVLSQDNSNENLSYDILKILKTDEQFLSEYNSILADLEPSFNDSSEKLKGFDDFKHSKQNKNLHRVFVNISHKVDISAFFERNKDNSKDLKKAIMSAFKDSLTSDCFSSDVVKDMYTKDDFSGLFKLFYSLDTNVRDEFNKYIVSLDDFDKAAELKAHLLFKENKAYSFNPISNFIEFTSKNKLDILSNTFIKTSEKEAYTTEVAKSILTDLTANIDKIDFELKQLQSDPDNIEILSQIKNKIYSNKTSALLSEFYSKIDVAIKEKTPIGLYDEVSNSLKKRVASNDLSLTENFILHSSILNDCDKLQNTHTANKNKEVLRAFNSEVIKFITSNRRFIYLLNSNSSSKDIFDKVISKSSDIAFKYQSINLKLKNSHRESFGLSSITLEDDLLNCKYNGILSSIDYMKSNSSDIISHTNKKLAITSLITISSGISQSTRQQTNRLNSLNRQKENKLTKTNSKLVKKPHYLGGYFET